MDALSKLEAVALAKELCEAAVSSLGSPCSRLLFCPLCTQSFGYSYGLEVHLLSVHHEELLDSRRHREDRCSVVSRVSRRLRDISVLQDYLPVCHLLLSKIKHQGRFQYG